MAGEQPRFENWIDRQIREATERGEFDNLPGAGKPIQGLDGVHDPNWWLKSFVARNNIGEAGVPPSLLLRKQRDEIQTTLAGVRTEREAREIITELNTRIRESHRRPLPGPPAFTPAIDVEAALAEWRLNRGTR